MATKLYKNKDVLQKFLFLAFIVLNILNFCVMTLWIRKRMNLSAFFDINNSGDFSVQWQICLSILKGIDIYPLRGTGVLYKGFHASPWGCLLENIFYGGFLSFDNAIVYFIVVNIITIIAASYVLYVKVREILPELGIYALIASIMSNSFFTPIFSNVNAGGMICAFLVIAWAVCDEHPVISGILIGFAMVKPQSAMPLCLLLLFTRRFMPLIIGAIIDISAWAAVSFMVNKNMIEILKEFLFTKTDWYWGGIFTLAFDNFMAAMLASMLLGIIFIYLLIRFLPSNMPEFFKAYPAFMTPMFWCYDSGNDFYMLIVPALLCLWLMLILSGKIRIFWWISAAYLLTPVINILRRIFGGIAGNTAWIIIKTFYSAGIILLGIFIYMAIRQLNRKLD